MSGVLTCQECGGFSGHALGWIAVLIDGKPGEEPYVVTYCPACAEREFSIVSLRVGPSGGLSSTEVGVLEAAAARARWQSVFLNRRAEELVSTAGECRKRAGDLCARAAHRRRARVTRGTYGANA